MIQVACPVCKDTDLKLGAIKHLRPKIVNENAGVSPSSNVSKNLLESSNNVECKKCTLAFFLGENKKSLVYDYKSLLSELNWKKYIRYSLLQNNGFISYRFLQGASCSIPGRTDAIEFGRFLNPLIADAKTILDLGCGPIERPEYFNPEIFKSHNLIGLDPFESDFKGFFINGTAEFIPLADYSVCTVVAATSLDHVFDLKLSLIEIKRVLKPNGRLVIWNCTPESNIRFLSIRYCINLRNKIKSEWLRLRENGWRRVFVYDNGIVLSIVRGSADPFHSVEAKRNWHRNLAKELLNLNFSLVFEDKERGFACWESKISR